MPGTGDFSDQPEFFPPTNLESSARAHGAESVRYRVDYLMLPMRDGARLATVVIRPKAGGRYPAFMIRTPYAFTAFDRFQDMHKKLFEADYVVIVQNERGSEWSEGEFGYLTHTTSDAMDTLDWIAAQQWSNGRVGLHGCSSSAENQLKLAAIGHPALRACVPMSSGAGVGDLPGTEGRQGLFFRGGVPMLRSWALWHAPFGIRLRPKLPQTGSDDETSRLLRRFSVSVPDFRLPEYATALARSTRQAPSGQVLRRMGAPLTGFEEFMSAGPAGKAWEAVDLINASHAGATPSLNINGWMDIGAYDTIKLFEFQQHHPEQYLIMAGTGHCRMTVTAIDARLGDRPMGDTRFPYDEVVTNWFHRWLRDQPAAWEPMPRVQVFLMGAGIWLKGESWPLPETEERSLYLASGGSANTLWGDGELLDTAGGKGADHFISDPHNPVPSMGGDLGIDASVCADQRPVECRADVLVYSTPALQVPVSFVGDVSAELYVSADVPDTDVFIKLVDVYPDGTAYNLAEACLRLRYRDSLTEPALLVPGEIYRIEVRGITTANYFPAGHRIRLEVAGSNFPLLDRNWHTGGENEREDDGPIAQVTLHHGAAHPSRLRFRAYTGEVEPDQAAL
ncbi:MAG TPA: CocE/NonD family hydrolase [Streptosporangiaceae bacterium]|nr:CocE/NonD family hydrolase [Streptosporangiaceae bacterium]